MISIDAVKLLYGLFCLSLCFVALLPMTMLVFTFPNGKRFSELWILGEGHIAENYPVLVDPEVDYRVFVEVVNHMGGSHYYLLYVKLANQTQPLPDPSVSAASPLPSLYEFRFFLQDSATWGSLVVYAFHNVTRGANSLHVGSFSINNVKFDVDCFSTWDPENEGFYFQLVFELWHYNVALQDFEFHNRFVKIWFNMTA